MEQFKKWQSKREVKTIGYLNNSSAYNAGEENGWRAALRWARAMHDISSEPRFIMNIKDELRDT